MCRRSPECSANVLDIEWLKQVGGSRLTSENGRIAEGIASAELPHEGVPARNLLFLAHAASFCDAEGIRDIYMGLNLEEGAVYPDNTIEFYQRAEGLLQFATIVRPRIRMPLARLMKMADCTSCLPYRCSYLLVLELLSQR
jgi:7-cyano-7-deazaguanine synthase